MLASFLRRSRMVCPYLPSTAQSRISLSTVAESCPESDCPLRRDLSSAGEADPPKIVLQCSQCRKLSDPPQDMDNFFRLFDISQSFDVDTRALSKIYKKMQTELHPDKFGNQSEEQKRFSELWSSHVNDGYQNLKKPLSRALYLLELNGQPLKEGEINLDAIFLAEIMEINEEVGEAETPVDLSGISQHNKKIIGQYVENVSKAFGSGDLEQARALIAKMKYYSNIQDRINKIETTWGITE